MIRVSKTLEESGSKAKMLLQVHDELVFEIPDEELEIIEPIIRLTMENSAQLDVPLTVETGTGLDWSNAH